MVGVETRRDTVRQDHNDMSMYTTCLFQHRRRHQVREGTSGITQNQGTLVTVTSERCPRLLNLQTYKLHALGDYAAHIRMYGTTDSYSSGKSVMYCYLCLSLRSYTASRVSSSTAPANIDS